MKREFIIDTPLGKLRVSAKHDRDCTADYPGVYVDLLQEGKDAAMLACVEYASGANHLQTCVYQPEIDEPVEIIHHDLNTNE